MQKNFATNKTHITRIGEMKYERVSLCKTDGILAKKTYMYYLLGSPIAAARFSMLFLMRLSSLISA